MTTEYYEIPLPTSAEPNTSQQIKLDGQSFQFRIKWNSRTDRYTFGIKDAEGVDLVNGGTLVYGVDLLRTIPNTLDNAPVGRLYMTEDAALSTIDSLSLYYLTEEE